MNWRSVIKPDVRGMDPWRRLAYDLGVSLLATPTALLLSLLMDRDTADAVRFGLTFTAAWIFGSVVRFLWVLRTRNDN